MLAKYQLANGTLLNIGRKKMNNSICKLPTAYNEPIKTFLPASPERELLDRELARQMGLTLEIPLIINGQKIHTTDTGTASCPHDHGHILATFSRAQDTEIHLAIEAALAAKPAWEAMAW
jgi:1-pyrroline-5-carboxylate dehydrogenase